MNVADILGGLADAAAEQPVLLLTLILACGGALGALRIKSFSLGPAAVLFAALAFSAADARLKLPSALGIFGLAVFAYVIGVGAGPSFFVALRRGGRTVAIATGALLLGAAITVVTANALGLHGPVLAGIYAGALTNTPALAAAQERWASDQTTVGYSVTYLFGVLGMLMATQLALRLKPAHTPLTPATEDPAPPTLDGIAIRVETPDLPDLGTIAERYHHQVLFARIMRGDTFDHRGVIEVATDDATPVPGDIVGVIGDPVSLQKLTTELGHPSTVALALDRTTIDYRRIPVSNAAVAGQPLSALNLRRRYGAVATRIRRGDVDILATDDMSLQIGDRVRIVAPHARMGEVAKLLGDSEKGASTYSVTSFALGLALGVLLGELAFPLPGGGTFALGLAGGPLLVGLIVGRAGRSGPVLWTLPHSVASTLSQLGMMMFLAYAGSNAGSALVKAMASPTGPRLFAVGLVVTTVTAATLVAASHWLGGISGPRLGGLLAGAQTQPAVLAYANDATDDDARVNLGYALVYPAAMILKVIIGPLLGHF